MNARQLDPPFASGIIASPFFKMASHPEIPSLLNLPEADATFFENLVFPNDLKKEIAPLRPLIILSSFNNKEEVDLSSESPRKTLKENAISERANEFVSFCSQN